MAGCDLRQISAGGLKLPQLAIPTIERPDLSQVKEPEENDCEKLVECFAWSTPFGGKIKAPCPVDNWKSNLVNTLKLGLDVISQISVAMVPIETVTKFIEPIEAGLAALSGETDPSAIVTALVDIATELATLLSTITGTYPLILLSELLIMIEKICEAIDEIKELIAGIISFVSDLTQIVTDAATEIISQISKKITDAAQSILEAATNFDDRKSSFDDDLNELLGKKTKIADRTSAFFATVVGGGPKLAAEGLGQFKKDVQTLPGVKGSREKYRNFLIGDPDEPEDRGIRGPTEKFFDGNLKAFNIANEKTFNFLGAKNETKKFKLDELKIQMDAELPKLEDCFTAQIEGIAEAAGKYIDKAQTLLTNVVEKELSNLTGALDNLVIPLLDAIPTCPGAS